MKNETEMGESIGKSQSIFEKVDDKTQLQASNSSPYDNYIENIKRNISSQANIDKAEEHRFSRSFRTVSKEGSVVMPVISFSTWKMSSVSLGLAFYFTLLKQMIIAMFIISILSFYPLILNVKGNYYTGSEIQTQLVVTSIGNIYKRYTPGNDYDLNTLESQYTGTWVCDFISSLLFLALVLFYSIYMNKLLPKFLKENPKISDFTVKVEKIPGSGITAKAVADHFSQFGDVVEVFLWRELGEYLPYYIKKAKISEEKMIRKSLVKFDGKNPKDDDKYKKLKEKLDKCDLKISEKGRLLSSNENFEINSAYVVFRKSDDKNKCLKECNKRNIFGCRKRVKKVRLEKIHLNVKQAREPSDIIWENLEISLSSRIYRNLFSTSLTLVLLFIAVIFLCIINAFQNKLPLQSECNLFKLQEKGDGSNLLQRVCYCKSLDVKDTSSACSDYYKDLSNAIATKFIFSIFVYLINSLMDKIVQKLSNFEKHHSNSYMQITKFRKMFLLNFINSAIMVYLINLLSIDISSSLSIGVSPDDQFTRDWFQSTGLQILISMIFSFSIPLNTFLVDKVYHLCKRKYFSKKKKTQYELNQIYAGTEFDIAQKHSKILSTIFTCYLYSGGIPLLNFICLGFLIVNFFVEKWLILKEYQTPPKYDHQIYFSVLSSLPFVIFMHCCVSLYTFGSNDIFKLDFARASGFYNVLSPNQAQRLSRPSGIANFILIIVSIAIFITLNFIEAAYYCKLKPEIQSPDGMDYIKLRKKIEEYGLSTYDIRKNPKYAMVVHEIDKTNTFRGEEAKDLYENKNIREVSIDEYKDIRDQYYQGVKVVPDYTLNDSKKLHETKDQSELRNQANDISLSNSKALPENTNSNTKDQNPRNEHDRLMEKLNQNFRLRANPGEKIGGTKGEIVHNEKNDKSNIPEGQKVDVSYYGSK